MDHMHCWFSQAHLELLHSYKWVSNLHYQLESGKVVQVTQVDNDKAHDEEYRKLWPDAVYLGIGTYHHGIYHQVGGIELKTYRKSPVDYSALLGKFKL